MGVYDIYTCLFTVTHQSFNSYPYVRLWTPSLAQSLPLSAVIHQAINSCQTSNNISCTKFTPVCSQTPNLQQLSNIQHHQLHKAYPCLQSDTKPSTTVRHPTLSAAQSLPLSAVRHQAFNSCQSNIQHQQLHKAYPCLQSGTKPSTAVKHPTLSATQSLPYPCLQSDTKPSTDVRHQTTSAAQNLPLSAVGHQAFNSCLSVSEPSALGCLLADKDVVCVWHETPWPEERKSIGQWVTGA